MSQEPAKDAIRIGWQVGTSLADALRIAIMTYKGTLGTKDDREAKKLQKENEGKEFSKRDRFVVHSKSQDKSEFESTHLQDDELKIFKKLSKAYGLDVLIEKKPEGLESLMAKPSSQRSDSEKRLLDKWTTGEGTGRRLVKEDFKITVATKDLNILEMVVDDMAEKTYNLDARKEAAKAKKKEMDGLDKGLGKDAKETAKEVFKEGIR